jgi:hypothetical protein
MGKWLCLAALALITGCIPIERDPARDTFGVSAEQPAAAGNSQVAPEAAKQLEWQVAQYCTLGHIRTKESIEPAEGGRQLADRELICKSYTYMNPLPFSLF